ncbi:MAG: hypothetical protein AB7G11_09395 [Phycisphaerales bacterium]
MAGSSERFWTPKWRIVAPWWVLQSLVIYFVGTAWARSATEVDGSNPLGLYSWDQYVSALAWSDSISWCAGISVAIAAAQTVFLLPVRQPGPRRAKGWPIRFSLAVAALAITALFAGVCTSFVHGIDLFVLSPRKMDWNDLAPHAYRFSHLYLAGACVLSWAIFTPLLIAFCKPGPRESVLRRVASRLFLGTMIEVAAIIPLDVMIRRRGSCYCAAGTYFALCFCGVVALFAAGPAILLPVMIRRRKRWYLNRCDCCGYDMSGCLNSAQCPECGAGWRRAPDRASEATQEHA